MSEKRTVKRKAPAQAAAPTMKTRSMSRDAVENSICIRFAGLQNESLELGHNGSFPKRDQSRIDEFYRGMKQSFAYRPNERSGEVNIWQVPEDGNTISLEFKKYTYGAVGARILAVINQTRHCAVIWAVNTHDGDYRFNFEEYEEIIRLWEEGKTGPEGPGANKVIARPDPKILKRVN